MQDLINLHFYGHKSSKLTTKAEPECISFIPSAIFFSPMFFSPNPAKRKPLSALLRELRAKSQRSFSEGHLRPEHSPCPLTSHLTGGLALAAMGWAGIREQGRRTTHLCRTWQDLCICYAQPPFTLVENSLDVAFPSFPFPLSKVSFSLSADLLFLVVFLHIFVVADFVFNY